MSSGGQQRLRSQVHDKIAILKEKYGNIPIKVEIPSLEKLQEQKKKKKKSVKWTSMDRMRQHAYDRIALKLERLTNKPRIFIEVRT